jgi:hypothetical protein
MMDWLRDAGAVISVVAFVAIFIAFRRRKP